MYGQPISPYMYRRKAARFQHKIGIFLPRSDNSVALRAKILPIFWQRKGPLALFRSGFSVPFVLNAKPRPFSAILVFP